MSFQSLVSGSECGVASNPLGQVLKHTEGDRSLQQDRIAGPSSSNLRQLPGTVTTANEHDLALARQFFEAGPQPQQPLVPGPLPFSPSPHATELAVRQRDHYRTPLESDLSESWKIGQRNLNAGTSLPSWATEFNGSTAMGAANTSAGQHQNGPTHAETQRSLYLQQGLYGSRPPMSMFDMGSQGVYMNASYNVMDQGKGKGKSREIDFDAAFEQIAATLTSSQADASRIVEVQDEVKEVEEALRSTSLDKDFNQMWQELQNSDLPPPEEDKAKWEAEFNQLMNAQRDELDYGAGMQEAWENGLGDLSDHSLVSERPMQFDDEGIPLLENYRFEKDNKYLDPSTSSNSGSLLQDAKALLDMNGSLSEAAIMLEAAIQKGDLGEGGFEAWILLGDVRTMDEREDAGMRAMIQGIKLAEAAGADGAGMMSLAISFTNESYDKGSHAMLLRWLRAKYPDHPVPEETIKAMKTHSAWDTHARMTDLFLSLARVQHSQGVLDPDVQVGLGVLFYTNGEYDRAKDCFEAALSVRPKDYLLWNRLGSALSNGYKPEEALGAYREALSIRPTYTRAIYNVGVACLNIGAHKESAEHFLSALSLQEMTNGGTSEQLWHTLRRALVAMASVWISKRALC
ncbi:hypothetical protein AX17_004005 [Amanita inopinata Kibby_2008]|nr:hypothetical protein AX17_004005 [Amanita inopinata Kibby_2008]